MPDAWDDDWISKADSSATTSDPAPIGVKISKAERRAKQAEFNRQIWEKENTEKPEDNFFLQTQGIVPLKSEFKPALKVLSRKPAKKSVNADGTLDLGQLGLDDDDDDEDEARKNTMTPEERLQKSQRDREEKQKAYEERRRQLFGKDEGSPISNVATSIGKKSESRNQSRNKSERESRPSSSASSRRGQLYDPNETSKPEALRVQKKDAVSNTTQLSREPKAPDGSGKGGFGFSPRGGRAA